jgi:two-component system, OmpR family, KDP operon response regulator KdpE
MNSINILLIGDEPNILRTLRRNLTSRGYEVMIAFDDQEAYEMAAKITPDLFVLNLDFTITKINGLEIVANLRKKSHSPIIILSSIGSETTKIQALDLGADDYLVMPANVDEFLARVRSSLRRWLEFKNGASKSSHLLMFRELFIDTDTRQVTVRGKLVRFTHTEYDLMLYLVKQCDKVITHKELIKAVWGIEYGEEREYLRVFISQLRQKIEDDPLNPTYILTEPGVGYRFSS